MAQNCADLAGAPPDLASVPWAAPSELRAQTLDLGRPCVYVTAKDGWRRVEPKALGWNTACRFTLLVIWHTPQWRVLGMHCNGAIATGSGEWSLCIFGTWGIGYIRAAEEQCGQSLQQA
uniref:Uncharacterized protein n=1 Tax=Eutreptiella gymnastica TaxID=73025 RepID=A0A7S4LAF1_9EUGL|mmetsp:Transcript_87576/g.145999  ORF Transcript_87576/g.145999 Transcript_87576/m.145999 type:complete len:119 (+) Transcript_87576:215-571(+)